MSSLSCLGKLDIDEIFRIALRHGVKVVASHNPKTRCWTSVCLSGSVEQMAEVEAELSAAESGRPVCNLDWCFDGWVSPKSRMEAMRGPLVRVH